MLTTVCVPVAQEQGSAVPDVFTQLDRIATMPSWDMQWAHLESLEYRTQRDPGLATPLLEYAARPGGSLLIRSYALDIAVGTSLLAVEEAERIGQPPTAEQQAIHDLYRRFVPAGSSEAINYVPYVTERTGRAYSWFFRRLAVSEGINPTLVMPDAANMGYDPTTVPTNVPSVAVRLLQRLIGGQRAIDINYMSPNVARGALELALDFRSDAYERAVADQDSPAIARVARLWRLTQAGGVEHDGPLDALHASGEEGPRYAEALSRLYDTVPLLSELYPTVAPEATAQSVRGLIANALFALQYYQEHGGQIDTTIAFPNGAPIQVYESNPLELIDSLTQAITIAHHAVTSLRPVFGEGSADFHQCVFADDIDTMPTVAYHGRAQGGDTFDSRYEFAGDATSRYRVQLSGDRPISFLNAEQAARTVGFRFDLDRFGFAFDVGALRENPYVNNPDDLEVRLGRFFALGNYLRCQQVGEDPTMNHVRGFETTVAAFASGITAHEQWLRGRAFVPVSAAILAASR